MGVMMKPLDWMLGLFVLLLFISCDNNRTDLDSKTGSIKCGIVLMPDKNLRLRLMETLNIKDEAQFCSDDLLNITGLELFNLRAHSLSTNAVSNFETDGLTPQIPHFPTGLEISDLTGLEYATNLVTLNLSWNYIEDITPISKLSHLEELILDRNPITVIPSLNALSNLKLLSLDTNAIKDISSLSGLKKLKTLNIVDNPIDDIRPLENLTELTTLSVIWANVSDVTPLAKL
jgi:Leucine-rich repeat (LRR) protein